MQTTKSSSFRLLAVLIIAAMVFGVLPATHAQAATAAQTLYVANWTPTTTVGVNGRPIVIKDGDTYHLWYSTSDTTLIHSTSTNPALFSTGTTTTYDINPAEVGSPAIIKENGVFYMITYRFAPRPIDETTSTPANNIFSLYSSSNGNSWTYIKDVFDCTVFPAGTYNKFDVPFLFKDGDKYRLYFQLKSFDKTTYRIYTAETTTSISDSSFAFTLANSGNPVLEPGSGTWDGKVIMHAWVIKDNGTYFMYFTGGVATGVGIGVAKSADGYTWVKSPANPLFAATGESVVIKDGDTWRMWYLGNEAGGPIKYFTSTGPIEFSSIQAAINAATAGDTISVAPGTYNESVLVNKFVKIVGSGNDEAGTVVNTPTNIDSSLGVFQITASGLSDLDPILLQNIRILPNGRAGVSIGKFTETTSTFVSNIKLDNVAVIGTNNYSQTEQERGLYVGPISTLDHVTIVNSAFNNLAYGWYLQKAVSADTSTVSNVSVTGTSFNHNNYKGLYAEKLTEAIFTDCSWSLNGFAANPITPYFNPWMGGVDINLKAGTYQNIQIINPTITNNGVGGAQNGAGIAIKARNDATSYNTFPATLTNVLIQGGTITGNERGIRIGEPGKNNAGPTNVKIQNVAIYNNEKTYTGTDGTAYGDVINYSLTHVDASPLWYGSAGGPAAGKIYGDVTYAPWCTNAGCTTFAPVNGQIIFPEGSSEIDIQTAINNAPAYTTIVIPAGTYNLSGGFIITKPHLTILLSNGAIIKNSSPCFIVNADYTKITAETLGNAKCVPTGGANGIDVAAGLKDIRIIGLDIDGSDTSGSGDGIHFAGAVSDVLIDDNIIHDLDGIGINFTVAPTSTVEIKGNLIKGNTGVGVYAPSDLDVKYNSWGKMTGPVSGTDVSAAITSFAPFTHADLSLVSSGTPWTDHVLPGNTITYTVYADFQSVMGADFKLDYPVSLTLGSISNVTTAFQPVPTSLGATLVDTSTPGTISFAGYTTTKVSGHVALFDVTFTAPATGGLLDLNLDETNSTFVMSPGYGASNNIYANALKDAQLDVITDLPTMTAAGLDTFTATYPKEFTLTITNPASGVSFDTPQLQFNLPVEYFNGTAWQPAASNIDLPALINDGLSHEYKFRVTFTSAGSPTVTVNLKDTHFTNTLATLSQTVTVNPLYTVTGTFSMQGRSVRSGIVVNLISTLFGTKTGTTIDIMSGNLSIANVASDTYTITTNQPRYLNVTADLGKTKAVSGNTTINSLELKGGNATDDGTSLNSIDVFDASRIGTDWGQDSTHDGDVNFSGKVDIFDLALVGGNYGLTSATAYTWIP